MDNPPNKTALLQLVNQERQALEAILNRASQAQMTQSGVENGWSIKDILAHITAWEKLMCRWLEEAMHGLTPDRPQTDDDIDRINARLYQANRNKPLAEVLAGFHASYRRALEVIHSVPEEALFDPHRYAWRGGSPLWHMVGGNTFWHYRDHSKTIQAWLAAEGEKQKGSRSSGSDKP